MAATLPKTAMDALQVLNLLVQLLVLCLERTVLIQQADDLGVGMHVAVHV